MYLPSDANLSFHLVSRRVCGQIPRPLYPPSALMHSASFQHSYLRSSCGSQYPLHLKPSFSLLERHVMFRMQSCACITTHIWQSCTQSALPSKSHIIRLLISCAAASLPWSHRSVPFLMTCFSPFIPTINPLERLALRGVPSSILVTDEAHLFSDHVDYVCAMAYSSSRLLITQQISLLDALYIGCFLTFTTTAT